MRVMKTRQTMKAGIKPQIAVCIAGDVDDGWMRWRRDLISAADDLDMIFRGRKAGKLPRLRPPEGTSWLI